jgi:SH3 domain-containing protein
LPFDMIPPKFRVKDTAKAGGSGSPSATRITPPARPRRAAPKPKPASLEPPPAYPSPRAESPSRRPAPPPPAPAPSSPVAEPDPKPEPEDLVLCMVKAIYNYDGVTDEELSLKVGDVVKVHERADDGWWTGTVVGEDRKGVFPGSYTEEAKVDELSEEVSVS